MPKRRRSNRRIRSNVKSTCESHLAGIGWPGLAPCYRGRSSVVSIGSAAVPGPEGHESNDASRLKAVSEATKLELPTESTLRSGFDDAPLYDRLSREEPRVTLLVPRDLHQRLRQGHALRGGRSHGGRRGCNAGDQTDGGRDLRGERAGERRALSTSVLGVHCARRVRCACGPCGASAPASRMQVPGLGDASARRGRPPRPITQTGLRAVVAV